MKIISLTLILLILLTASVSSAGYSSKLQTPKNTQLIVAANQNVLNDIDISKNGAFAIDDYNKLTLIIKLDENEYSAVVQYVGTFETFAGALSPNKGTTLQNDASGTFAGAYLVHFNAKDCKEIKGKLPTIDLKATKEDVLSGKEKNSQTDLDAYCSGITNIELRDQKWRYQLGEQRFEENLNGIKGDIVT